MLTDAQVLSESVKVLHRSFLGLMTTVDQNGMPFSRWMGTSLSTDGLHEIFTLSGKNTRKVRQLALNPAVCWVYSTEDCSDVVALYGKAEVMESPAVSQAVWDRLMECAREYVVNTMNSDDETEFVTIRTVVERVEFISPRLGILAPRTIEFQQQV